MLADEGTYVDWCKARYKSKVLKLIERYDKWHSGFSTLFNLKKTYKFEIIASILIINISVM